MSRNPRRALCLDPTDRPVTPCSATLVEWARAIPDLGWFPEMFALFTNTCAVLLRAVWLGAALRLDDVVAWPDVSLGWMPAGATGVTLLVCRPGDGVGPSSADLEVAPELIRAHGARGVRLLDIVAVDGSRWGSLLDTS